MEIRESMRTKMNARLNSSARLSHSNQDFMILCPAAADNSGVIEALYALYYLPQNYKLLIAAVSSKSKAVFERVREIMRSDSIKNRVVFKDAAGLSKVTAPFLDANVVVYGSSDPMYNKSSPQSLVVFDLASKISGINGSHNFAVATSSPEALASAILRVARNQH